MTKPPKGSNKFVDIDARIDWYGTYIILQEQVMLINEDPVLNSAVSVLGQSLRETEDQLARSMMEGGKVCAPVKSWVIDLELLAA
jgi:N4-gp56 family major capsid protein